MLLRRLTPLVFLACAPIWAQSSSAAAQSGDSQSQAPQPQTAQSPQAPPESDKKPAADQTASIAPSDSTKLEPIRIQKATYPEEAREKHVQGQLWVNFSFGEGGDVRGGGVIREAPFLPRPGGDAA